MENIKNILSQNILSLRKFNKLTQFELAEKINYSDKAISRWEKGEAVPDIETLESLAKAFGVSVTYMLESHEPEEFNELKPNNQNALKILITILSIAVVWMTATVLFIYLASYNNQNYWQIFIWALPVSSLLLLYFNNKFGNKKFLIYLNSLLIWSFITAIYCHHIELNMWLIFLIGLPIQTVIIINYLKQPFKKTTTKPKRRNYDKA